MENLKIIYIDDYPETSLSKYLDKYKNSSCNVESLDIKFNPDAGYESLINNPDVKSANIIFIDSKLFENRTAIAGKFTGEEFKIILKKYFPFIEVIVITTGSCNEEIWQFCTGTEYADSRESGDRIDRGEWSGKEYDI